MRRHCVLVYNRRLWRICIRRTHPRPLPVLSVVRWRLRATSLAAAAAGDANEDGEADDASSAAENSHKQTEEWCLSESEKKDAEDGIRWKVREKQKWGKAE